MIEAERRWKLASNPPSENIICVSFIEQLSTGEEPKSRIRKETKVIDTDNRETSFTHTTKYKIDSFIKEEFEIEISEDQYNRVLNLYKEKPTYKKRTIVDIGGGLLAEVDEYFEENKVIIEVEFPSKQASENFKLPDWFGEEIIKMQSLWK